MFKHAIANGKEKSSVMYIERQRTRGKEEKEKKDIKQMTVHKTRLYGKNQTSGLMAVLQERRLKFS